MLTDVDKSAIEHRLEPLTQRYYDHFRLCPGCDRLYWRGTHVQGMEHLIAAIRDGRER